MPWVCSRVPQCPRPFVACAEWWGCACVRRSHEDYKDTAREASPLNLCCACVLWDVCLMCLPAVHVARVVDDRHCGVASLQGGGSSNPFGNPPVKSPGVVHAALPCSSALPLDSVPIRPGVCPGGRVAVPLP